LEKGGNFLRGSWVLRFKNVYKTDVYVLAFCLDDADDGPASLRKARRTLAKAMQQALGEAAKAG
jgi:hypothetical protein